MNIGTSMSNAKNKKAAAGPSQRQLRAGELIRHALVEVLAREAFRDPDLQGVSITISEVRMSPDLKHATAFAAPLGGKDALVVVKALNRCSKFLRGVLAREIDLKFTPDLHFHVDESFDEAGRIGALLARPDVARDLDAD